MILQNLSRAIREQNYYAVVLEFVIVIAGVVIGFQINAWNEGRTARSHAANMTERLIEDLQDEHWRLRGATAYYQQLSDNAALAVELLGAEGEPDDEALVVAAYRATQIFGYPVIRATYEELVATGDINLIADDALRTLTIEYYEADLDNPRYIDQTQPYRHAVFRLIDRSLFELLRERCGEPLDFDVGQYDRIETLLTGPCDLGELENIISASALRLRSSPGIVDLLRQRANEALIQSGNAEYWLDRIEAVGITEHRL